MNIEVIPAWWGSLRRCTVHCGKDHPRELATGQTRNGVLGAIGRLIQDPYDVRVSLHGLVLVKVTSAVGNAVRE